jgi:hypothetical protein
MWEQGNRRAKAATKKKVKFHFLFPKVSIPELSILETVSFADIAKCPLFKRYAEYMNKMLFGWDRVCVLLLVAACVCV